MKRAILTCIGIFTLCLSVAQVSTLEKEVLLDLYRSTNGSQWTHPWDLLKPVDTWHGISVEHGHVTEISLLFNNMEGSLPNSLGKLEHLKKLELSFNPISGNIPPEIGDLKNLEVLAINGANLEGEIPTELGNLANLKQLHLSSNKLNGLVPISLGNLKNIEVFNVFDNQLFGALPSELARCKNLRELMVAKNNFNNPHEFSIILLANSGASLNLNEESPQIESTRSVIAVEREDSDE